MKGDREGANHKAATHYLHGYSVGRYLHANLSGTSTCVGSAAAHLLEVQAGVANGQHRVRDGVHPDGLHDGAEVLTHLLRTPPTTAQTGSSTPAASSGRPA
jgi:hypothetical protein